MLEDYVEHGRSGVRKESLPVKKALCDGEIDQVLENRIVLIDGNIIGQTIPPV